MGNLYSRNSAFLLYSHIAEWETDELAVRYYKGTTCIEEESTPMTYLSYLLILYLWEVYFNI